MPSSFSNLFAGCAATALVNQFGERDSIGDLAFALYHSPTLPSGSPAKQFAGPVWTEIRFEEQPDFDGGMVRRELRTCVVRRSIVEEAGIAAFESDAWIEDPAGDPDSAWMLDEGTTEWGPVFVTFGVVRMPLLNRNECRSADV